MADRLGSPATRTEVDSARWVPEWLSRQAAERPARLALIAGPVRWTFQELDRHAGRTARRLAALGVAEGSRVAVLLRNGPPFVVLTHALLRLGAVMIPLHARLAAPEIAWQLGDSNAAVLVSDARTAPLASEVARDRPDLRCVTIGNPPTLLDAREADV